ncbi:MAG: hypothetical protein AAGF02_17860, partial [Actinomycetota bacterium]
MAASPLDPAGIGEILGEELLESALRVLPPVLEPAPRAPVIELTPATVVEVSASPTSTTPAEPPSSAVEAIEVVAPAEPVAAPTVRQVSEDGPEPVDAPITAAPTTAPDEASPDDGTEPTEPVIDEPEAPEPVVETGSEDEPIVVPEAEPVVDVDEVRRPLRPDELARRAREDAEEAAAIAEAAAASGDLRAAERAARDAELS